jgi:hypothetical protein
MIEAPGAFTITGVEQSGTPDGPAPAFVPRDKAGPVADRVPAALHARRRLSIDDRQGWRTMSGIMAVLLNGIAQMEFDRNKFIRAEHKAYLRRMDEKMDAGIELDGEWIADPDLGQRARFVANLLAQAIAANSEAQCAAAATWLAERLPDLKQVKIRDEAGVRAIDLVFDEDYVKQQPIMFGKPGS